MERLGLRVKRFREERGLSLRDLSTAVGITPQSVHAWEKGKSAVPSQDVPTIAARLGVTICELYGVDEGHKTVNGSIADVASAAFQSAVEALPEPDQEFLREIAAATERFRSRLVDEEGLPAARRAALRS